MRTKSIFFASAVVAIASASLLTLSAVAKQNDICAGLTGQDRAACVHQRGLAQGGNVGKSSSLAAGSVASLSAKQQHVKTCKQVLKEWTKQRNQAHKEWHRTNKVGGGNQGVHKEWHKQRIAELKALLRAIKAGNCAGFGSSSMSSSSMTSSASSLSSVSSSVSSSSSSSTSSASSASSALSSSAVSSSLSSASSSVASSSASSAESSSAVSSSVASSVSSSS